MRPNDKRDIGALVLLALALIGWFAAPGLVRGHSFPVGPDTPVYLWWTRLVGVEGLSSVTRPGVPALASVLAGTLGLPISVILGAIEIAGGALIGVGAAVLLRIAMPERRATWLLGGALTGTFASHIVTGYLATLVFALLFLTAAAGLATGARRGTIMATAMLGAGAIAHPRFLAVGAAILVVAAVLAWREDQDETKRLLTSIIGAAAVLALAGVALLLGPSPLLADTSRDGFLRRAGLNEILRTSYSTRFLARWPRYAPWGLLPLAVAGIRRTSGTVGRILAGWTIVTIGGAIFSVVTGLLPVDRFITFGLALPMIAAVGATRIWDSLRWRGLARLVTAGLVAAMLVGAQMSWLRQSPFIDETDLAALEVANGVAVAAAGSALVFPVGSEASAFAMTLYGNAIRATVPPHRIRDVVITVAGSSSGVEADAMARLTDEDQREAALREGRTQRILVAPFAPSVPRLGPWTAIGDSLAVDPYVEPAAPEDAVEPYSPWLPLAGALACILLLGIIGLGWSRLSGAPDDAAAVASAPAIGIGVLVLVAFATERLGVPLSGTVGPFAISLIALSSAPVARLFVRR